jgi:NitT/TauT family transport system substrate-binding protein
VQAVFNAIKEAVDIVNRDKSAAGDLYLRLSGDKISKADLMTVLDDPHIIYSNVPIGTMAFAKFMHKAGTIKAEPADWKDFFFPIAHGLQGN